MSQDKKASDTGQPADREIEIRAIWFIPDVSVTVGVWEGDIEHAAFVVPIDVWLDINEMAKRIEIILGGSATCIR